MVMQVVLLLLAGFMLLTYLKRRNKRIAANFSNED
jgi:hypothetical protein